MKEFGIPYTINRSKLDEEMRKANTHVTENAKEFVISVMPLIYEAYIAGSEGTPLENIFKFLEPIE